MAPKYEPPSDGQLRTMIRQSWEQHSPKMYARLRQSGKLDEEIAATARDTKRYAANLIATGLRPHEAWEQAMREHALRVWDDRAP